MINIQYDIYSVAILQPVIAACGGRNFEQDKWCDFSRGRTASTIWLLIYIRYISYGDEFVVSPIFNSAGNKSHFSKGYIQ